MRMKVLLLLTTVLALGAGKEDITKEKLDEHYGADGDDHDVEYDHQAVLGQSSSSIGFKF